MEVLSYQHCFSAVAGELLKSATSKSCKNLHFPRTINDFNEIQVVTERRRAQHTIQSASAE